MAVLLVLSMVLGCLKMERCTVILVIWLHHRVSVRFNVGVVIRLMMAAHILQALIRVALMFSWVRTEPFFGFLVVKAWVLVGTIIPQFSGFSYLVASTVVTIWRVVFFSSAVMATVLLRVSIRVFIMDVLSLIVMVLMVRAGSLLMNVRQIVEAAHPVRNFIGVHIHGIRVGSGIQ